MTTQHIEFDTISDEQMQAAAGGVNTQTKIVTHNPVVINIPSPQPFPFSNKSSFLTMSY